MVTDALFNHDDTPGLPGLFFKYVTASTGHFGISRLGKLLLLKERRAYADYLRAWADDPQLRGVVVGHGDAVIEDLPDRLRAAAARV